VARLTAGDRRHLKSSEFAAPGQGKGPGGKGAGSYPINDPEHARKALQMIGHAGPAKQKQIRAAVHRRYPGIGKG
jgi:hypothetical protein